MALRAIQEYIARYVNNIARVADVATAQTRIKKHETRNKTVKHIRGFSSASLRNKEKHCF